MLCPPLPACRLGMIPNQSVHNSVVIGPFLHNSPADILYNPSESKLDQGAERRTEQRAISAADQSKSACPEVLVVYSQPSSSRPTDLTPFHPQTQFPLEEIACLLQKLPTVVCIELSRCFLSTALSLPAGEARPRAVLKTIIVFSTGMTAP